MYMSRYSSPCMYLEFCKSAADAKTKKKRSCGEVGWRPSHAGTVARDGGVRRGAGARGPPGEPEARAVKVVGAVRAVQERDDRRRVPREGRHAGGPRRADQQRNIATYSSRQQEWRPPATPDARVLAWKRPETTEKEKLVSLDGATTRGVRDTFAAHEWEDPRVFARVS